MNQVERETIRLYLLGRLDQAARDQVEERLLTDEPFYDELLIAEDELTDQYLTNGLSGEELLSFESHFLLAPERRQKLRFARSLRRYVNQATGTHAPEDDSASFVSDPLQPRSKKRSVLSFLPIQNPIVAYSLAAVFLFAIIGISWSVLNLRQATRGSGKVMLVNLTPGQIREGGEVKSIQIQPGTDSVQFQLGLLSDEYQSYRAELLSSDRAVVLTREGLKSESAGGNRIINLTLP
ncbi:MAG: hypothetical protein ND895_25660, partial [Pyrinomonadaceae bacterium]|nr:hypothetical protein [Pyrinomonadaceae bacterium]